MRPPRWAVRVRVAIGRVSQPRQVHAFKVAREFSLVFDTSAHLPFRTAVIRRYLLAAIERLRGRFSTEQQADHERTSVSGALLTVDGGTLAARAQGPINGWMQASASRCRAEFPRRSAMRRGLAARSQPPTSSSGKRHQVRSTFSNFSLVTFTAKPSLW